MIIVNYNTHEYLENVFHSIFRYLSNINFEIIVVDNNSTDRSIENWKRSSPM
ncbi:MAG: glycosyltransferase [Ignavibacteria bacterium]|nr:glycosyltransferase [Ignavibacteria bacterium]